jgi:excisionase family DNA binding protein
MSKLSDSLAYPPRGMSREEAARYVGVGTTKFDEMIADGRMPKPKAINGRRVWDRLKLDSAFDELPGDDDGSAENPADRAMAEWSAQQK